MFVCISEQRNTLGSNNGILTVISEQRNTLGSNNGILTVDTHMINMVDLEAYKSFSLIFIATY